MPDNRAPTPSPSPPEGKSSGPEASKGRPPKLEMALEDPTVPRLYANGFALAMSNADVAVVFQLAGRPNALVNLSYTLAKTLHTRLGLLMSDFETRTGRNILRTEDVDAAFAKETTKETK